MNTLETRSKIARHAILARAAFDGYRVDKNEPEPDGEGYIVSIFNALHHWCHAYGHDWTPELNRAQSLFEVDFDEHRQNQSPSGST